MTEFNFGFGAAMWKYAGVFIVGILIGALGSGDYFYKKLDRSNEMLAASRSELAGAGQAQHERDEQLQKVKAGLAAAQGELKQAVSARESVEVASKQALQTKDEMLQKVRADMAAAQNDIKQAVTAKETAEVSSKQALQTKDEQLQKVKADLAAAQGELKQAITAKQSAEASLKQAQDEKVAAERALAGAKEHGAQ